MSEPLRKRQKFLHKREISFRKIVPWYIPLPDGLSRTKEFDGFAYGRGDYILVAEHNCWEGESWHTFWPYSEAIQPFLKAFAEKREAEAKITKQRIARKHQIEFEEEMQRPSILTCLPPMMRARFVHHNQTTVGMPSWYEIGRVRYTRPEVDHILSTKQNDAGYMPFLGALFEHTPLDVALYCIVHLNGDSLYKTALRDLSSKTSQEELQRALNNQPLQLNNDNVAASTSSSFPTVESLKDAFLQSVGKLDSNLWDLVVFDKWMLVLFNKEEDDDGNNKKEEILKMVVNGKRQIVEQTKCRDSFVCNKFDLLEQVMDKHHQGGLTAVCIRSTPYYHFNSYSSIDDFVQKKLFFARDCHLVVSQHCPPCLNGIDKTQQGRFLSRVDAWVVRVDSPWGFLMPAKK